ncbi:MAG: NAD(P)H-hydrate dehydratase [Bacteroidales bacterium]|nr:NAD(P)H-hydrate dehydratase [Bacteroidales bacterium]
MAKLFTSLQIKQIDSYTIENEPITSVGLMERAASALFTWCKKKFNKNSQLLFFIGPGNNGGDGLALARILFHNGYENIRLYALSAPKGISPDAEINIQRLLDETDLTINNIENEKCFPYISPDEWIVDALFGTGLSRPLAGLPFSLVKYINSSKKAGVVSIDMPSGLFAEDNSSNHDEAIVRADYTLSFQFPKLSFFFAENEKYTGKWHILPIGLSPEKIDSEPSQYEYSFIGDLRPLVKPRLKFTHKGTYGHALIIAGSYGMMGAAVLAAKAAIRSGAGLVTCHVPHSGHTILQSSVPEAIVSIDESDLMFTGVSNLEKYKAVAIGPGINTKTNTRKALLWVIENTRVPLVIDADGLNILSENPNWLSKLPENTIFTPHPKEFDRLTQSHTTHYQRHKSAMEFARKHKLTLVLKGANTCIYTPDGTCWFNTTGNPGMAKGGSGDILTGIIVSLLAMGHSTIDAAKIAVFTHGMAGDLAATKKGQTAMAPSDIIKKLGKAFKKIEP